MAQLDVRLTGDQEVAGLILMGPATFFLDIDHEIFSVVILPSSDSRTAVVSFWQKNVQKYWAQLFKANDIVS